jgi:hypothetical protein
VNETPSSNLDFDRYQEVIRKTLFDWHNVPWESAVTMIEKYQQEIERDFNSGIVAADWVKRIYLEWRAENESNKKK